MGRPPRHDVDRLLDAAAELAVEAGPRAVTMAGVARRAGAPSGSVYHRFVGRSALLAALWLRTVERFQEGFLGALTTEPPRRAAVEAARHVLAWSRDHPSEARILLYGATGFGETDWPAEARDRLDAANGRVREALRALAARLGSDAPPDLERVVLLTVDLPYAAVRRHLTAGEPIPGYAERLVVECAEALLAPEPSGSTG